MATAPFIKDLGCRHCGMGGKHGRKNRRTESKMLILW